MRDRLWMEGTLLRSTESELAHDCGEFSVPSLAELRGKAARGSVQGTGAAGSIRVSEIVADVQALHADPANMGATFQVASQFNFLEMVGPSVTPEEGVTRYAWDGTQGPACAIACGAATIYRNYLVRMRGEEGQTRERQLDGLAELGTAIGHDEHPLWTMSNGYALLTCHGRESLEDRLGAMSQMELDALRGLLRVGVHVGAQVTLEDAAPSQRVNQIFGSAMPVSYGQGTAEEWRAISTLVLEASYEAALLQASLIGERFGSKPLYLTQLGGGVFRNEPHWIMGAIHRALTVVEPLLNRSLDVVLVSYGSPSDDVRELIERWHDVGNGINGT